LSVQAGAVSGTGEGRAGGSSAGAKLLYYFNGFNSAIPDDWSDNEKIVAVEQYAALREFLFLPRSINYRRARVQAMEILRRIRQQTDTGSLHVVFSGSSMGGWYARIMQLLLARDQPGVKVEALAFNPAFDLGQHGHMLLGPQVNFVTLEAYEWTARDSERIGQLEESVDYNAPLPFFVYVDKGDEVIPWEPSAARHAPIARFMAFEGGSHSFEHAREALQDFDYASRQRGGPA